jgi:Mce-associated membrane protein
VTAWLGYQAHQAHRVQQQRDLFISTARQAALNLTTISYTEADADVARILQSATGSFREDFQQRSQLFTDVVKHAQSTSVGTIIESGLESVDGDRAQVLVAASVKTSTPTSPTQENRSWRMRLTIATTEGAPKVANVQFVP